MFNKKCLVLLSGGLDSTTLAYWLASQQYTIVCVYFDYEQGEINAERECAKSIAKLLNTRLNIIDTQRPRDSLMNTPLILSDEAVLLTDVVSLCMMAATFAFASGIDAIYWGINANDRQLHPSLQPRFFRSIEKLAKLWLDSNLSLSTPFLRKNKASIMKIGVNLRVPFEKTWSCGVNVEKHCGRCSDCIARKQAFLEVGLADPTRYEHKS